MLGFRRRSSANRKPSVDSDVAGADTAGEQTPRTSASAESQRSAKKPIFYGWWIVLAGSISQAYTSGTFWQGFGAFFDPIIDQFGWSRALTAGAMSLQRTESGAISPFVGWFVDKFGPRNVMLFGTGLTALGFILLSRIQELWQFYAAFLVLTIGLSFGTFLDCNHRCRQLVRREQVEGTVVHYGGSGPGRRACSCDHLAYRDYGLAHRTGCGRHRTSGNRDTSVVRHEEPTGRLRPAAGRRAAGRA